MEQFLGSHTKEQDAAKPAKEKDKELRLEI
jgi:hypothetical protein